MKRDISRYLRVLLISFGACVLNAVGFYAVLTYLPNYLETTLNYPPSDASTITTIVLVVYIAFIFLSGRISDKVYVNNGPVPEPITGNYSRFKIAKEDAAD